MKGWVDLCGWLCIKMFYLSADCHHPSSNHLIATRLGVEPTTLRSQVKRPTKPQWFELDAEKTGRDVYSLSSHGASESSTPLWADLTMLSGKGSECRTIAPYSPYSAIILDLPHVFSVLRHLARLFWNHTCIARINHTAYVAYTNNCTSHFIFISIFFTCFICPSLSVALWQEKQGQ